MSTLRVTNIQDLAGNDVFSLSGGNMTVAGNLTVQGTTTSIDTTNLEVLDKNIILGNTTDPAPSDSIADGGGITLKGSTDKTFNWIDSSDSWTSSEHIALASSKEFKIGANSALSASTLSFSATSSSTPTDGVYSPSTNTIAISTNSADKLTVSSKGKLSLAPTGGALYIDPNPTSASPTVFLNRPYLPNTATGTSILFDTIGINYSDGADDGGGGTIAYTASALIHYRARPVSALNTSVTLTNQYGFYVHGDLDNAANNYGFYSNIAAPAEGDTHSTWNFYANGTADNYFAGKVGIGTSSPSQLLTVSGTKTATNVYLEGRSQIVSDQNWNFSSLRIEREASNTVNSKLISFLLDGDADNDTDLYAYPNLVLRTNTAPTTSSNSVTLAAKLEITAPAGVDLGVGSKPILATTTSGVDVNGALRESTDNGTTYHNVVTAQDVGTAPNQVPLNQFLGQMAFVDKVGDVSTSSSDPQNNLDINFEYVNDTTIRIRMRGSDGVVRSVTLGTLS